MTAIDDPTFHGHHLSAVTSARTGKTWEVADPASWSMWSSGGMVLWCRELPGLTIVESPNGDDGPAWAIVFGDVFLEEGYDLQVMLNKYDVRELLAGRIEAHKYWDRPVKPWKGWKLQFSFLGLRFRFEVC